jgi:small subunit ribosomal protein S3
LSSLKNVIKDNYNMMLLKEYLKTAIKESGFSHVDISKTPTGTRVVLHVTRPGIVIGRKGTGIRELTERLEKDFGLKSPQIAVNEIAEPELTASVMCNRLASLIERGTAFRRATMWTLQQIMNAGALGVQITVSGKLRGDRSSFEKHSTGILPRAGHKAKLAVDEGTVHVPTPMGYIGVRIRIARKERYIPDFELKGKEELAAQERKLAKEREEAEFKARTESEQIKMDAERIEKLDLMEEIEEELK